MNQTTPPVTFTVPLVQTEHRLAEQFRTKHCNQKKAKQVYLNTLAVSAVNFYLRCIGIETDWSASLSCNPVMQTLMDVSDLELPDLGSLECRPVLPETQVVYIPPEVWSNRIGYIAVRLDQSLKEATLLGFVKTVSTEELPLSQLGSLEDLLECLSQIHQPEAMKMRQTNLAILASVNLSQWFEHLFETGWQSLEVLLGKDKENLAFSLRSNFSWSEAGVARAKLVDLGLQLGSQAVALLVAITKEPEQKVGILVQVHPQCGETYLQPNLRVSLLSESGVTLQEVQSRSQDNYIQLKRFRVLPGECFNIQVVYGDASVTETFVL